MKSKLCNTVQAAPVPAGSFDLCRLSKSKELVDLASNTLRKFNREGLVFYRCGKMVFFSRSELAQFIHAKAA